VTREMNPELLSAVRFFTRESEIMDGMVLVCGDGRRAETVWDGEVRQSSVFDLASLTKLFTGLCAMRLKEEGLLDPGRSVFSCDARFTRLKDVTVEQLMSFTRELVTPGRVDACGSREEALACLFSAQSRGEPKGRYYSDIPSMVLKYVIEAAAGCSLMECVRTLVMRPAGMNATWSRVPEERIPDCLDYSREYRIEGSRHILRAGPLRGEPHDPKAAVIRGETDDLCGHAGLFSTAEDLTRFCLAVLEEKIVSRESLREMAVNRTGRRRPDGTYTQYLGYQCYVRHPDQYYSEIPVYMGRKAFGNSGFTGNCLVLDPERGTYVFFLGNRVRNRLTVLLPEEGKTLGDYGLRENGTGKIRRDDGTVIPSSVKYVHLKDEYLHRVIGEVMGWPEVPWICGEP